MPSYSTPLTWCHDVDGAVAPGCGARLNVQVARQAKVHHTRGEAVRVGRTAGQQHVAARQVLATTATHDTNSHNKGSGEVSPIVYCVAI